MEEEGDGVGRGSDHEGGADVGTAQRNRTIDKRARIEALVNAISQYHDVYPVLQRGVQFLCKKLCDGMNDEETTRIIQVFIETGALTDTVGAMTTNLNSLAFLSALWKTEIVAVLDKIVHSVKYQNEPACVQLGIKLLSKLMGSLESIENGLWTQLVSTIAQAMLTNSLDNCLQLECLQSLKLLFQLKTDAAVPATSANIILKTLDQCIRQPTGVSRSFASASVVVVFRIFGTSPRTPHLGLSAPILAAGLHHFQLTTELDETHKIYVEKLIQQPLQAAVYDSLTRLIDLALPSAESNSDAWLTAFQTATMKLLLGVVWREEARAFLDSGGVAVLASIFTSGSVLHNALIETALAQTLYYVSLHWPNETWNKVQINGTGLNKWFEAISDRCEDENDGLLHYLLAIMKTLLHCEGFREAFIENNGVGVFQSVLQRHQQLPLCTGLVVNFLMSARNVCPATALPALCGMVAETMFTLEASRTSQLECVKALSLLIFERSDKQTVLSSQHARGIIRVMRLKLMDEPFIGEMLDLVVTTLFDASTRALFVDLGLLQVVSKAICIYQWSPTESMGLNARWIICDVAHKLDVSRNVSTLEPHAHISNGLSFNPPAISTEALDSCCCMVGALASVNPLLPLLIEEGGIRSIVGVLRYSKQELVVSSEGSFIQLASTCFYALTSIVNAPIVTHVMESVEGTQDTIHGQSIYSRLVDSGADDAIIGCLEEALRVKRSPPLLVENGCRLLQAVLSFPIALRCETETRWIAVATSILQRDSTQQRTRELLFSTTLMVLSRGKRSVGAARGQHVKMMKVILEVLDASIQHESSCTLRQKECTGAIRVLERIAKASDSLSDALISRCLGVLGKLVGIFILSPSAIALEHILYFDNAIAFFATKSYVNRLMSRLERCVANEGIIESAAMADMAEDFKALKALLFSNQAKKTIDTYHPLFGYLAAVVENVTAYAQALGDHAAFFLELGCLTTQLLRTAQREEVINTALCHFAEDTAWHSMRWIAALADRGSGELTLIVEFVLLRIVSGYSILEPALLIELLDVLNYLLRRSQCREIVLASSHTRELQKVLWQLVYADVAHMDEAGGYDIAVSLLGIISTLISSFPGDIFSIQSEENVSKTLVRFCLGALDSLLSDTSVSPTKFALMEEVLQTTSIILLHCIQLGAEYVRSVIQHRATRIVFNISVGTSTFYKKPYEKWCFVVLGAAIQSHGLLYAEKLLRLSSDPSALLINLVDIGAHDSDTLPWSCFVDCITMVSGSEEKNTWQIDCRALFVELQDQSRRLVHGQPTVTSSRRVQKHITDTIAKLSFKHGQLRQNTSGNDMDGCLQEIAQSGLAFYELFVAAPSINAFEYSAVVSLHLKIARLAGFKTDTERSTIEESAVSIRMLLNPICISDEALADYLDLMTVVYLSPSIRAAAWLFIEASTNVLSKAMQRLATGLVRPQCLEKSVLNCFSSLCAVFDARRESGEVESVLELLKICSLDRWSQEILLESLLVLPQGLLSLFELARAAPTNDIHVIIMTSLFQHVNDIRVKTQRIGELELSAILLMIKRNVAGKVGDTSRRRWREVTRREMLHGALETLKHFARQKDCAILCSDLGGISTLYNVLCAPSQYEDNIQFALEICCHLASYGADLTQENFTFAVQLMFVFVEANVDSSRSRLAVLVLEYFLAVGVSALSLPMIQQCRTQIVPMAARSYEETEMFILQLYISRQKIVGKPKLQISIPNTSRDRSSSVRTPLNETEISDIILSSSRSIVQCTSGDGKNSYVDVNTSEKSVTEPLQYTRLRGAIDQLTFILDDPDIVINRRYVFALVPALSEILVLHTITTATICTIMQLLDQIAFINPSIVLSNEQLDIPALFASCSLHHRSSLPFARYLCRFCNSIAAELRAMADDLSMALVALLLELLQYWKSDFEIVDQVLATVHDLIRLMHIEQFERLRCGDILAQLNSAVSAYTSNGPTSWNWLKCALVTVDKLDMVIIESAQVMITTVVGIIGMFVSHSLMVERATIVLVRVYTENRQLPLRHLIELDGVDVLLTCLKLHANDDSIVRSCLKLLMSLASLRDTSHKTVDNLLTAAAAAPILVVSRKNLDNPLICGMCIELVQRMIESFDNHPGKNTQKSVNVHVLPGDTSRKKSELLTHLLEADIVPLVFDLLDNYSNRGNNRLLESVLGLFKCLTNDERLRESAEVLHGLQELHQTIDRIWEKKLDYAFIELAIDCLVNMACSDRAIGHGWKELPMWILQLAKSIHKLEADSTGMCVEKLIGILGRLTVDNTICKTISPTGSFTILQLLADVGNDRSLEQALYGLLSTLSEDIACAQILIVYDAIPITAERIICHVDDEDTLLCSLCFLDVLVLNSGESYPALQDEAVFEAVFEAIELVIQTYPEITGGQVYRIASTILEKVSALHYQSRRTKPTTAKTAPAKPAKVLKPHLQISDSEKPFYDLLREGAKFRVLWEARPDTAESIEVKLASSGDYLLFRRKASSNLRRVERVFVSQLEVCPQRSLIDQSKTPSSPSKKVLAQSLLRENFEGDRVLRLKVRDEDVLIKTNSTRERIYWDQALQWLVLHRGTHTSPTHALSLSPRHSS